MTGIEEVNRVLLSAFFHNPRTKVVLPGWASRALMAFWPQVKTASPGRSSRAGPCKHSPPSSEAKSPTISPPPFHQWGEIDTGVLENIFRPRYTSVTTSHFTQGVVGTRVLLLREDRWSVEAEFR